MSGFAIIGDAQQIRELLCGPIQHNEHMKGWRWHQYIADDAKRWEAVKAELRQMNAERREREEALVRGEVVTRLAVNEFTAGSNPAEPAIHARDERKHERV